jgi:hypothetical protein
LKRSRLPFFWYYLHASGHLGIFLVDFKKAIIVQKPVLHSSILVREMRSTIGQSVPVWRKSIAFLVGGSMNCRPQSRHLNLCLPLWMRPFLSVWEDAQMEQVGMGGEQPETRVNASKLI